MVSYGQEKRYTYVVTDLADDVTEIAGHFRCVDMVIIQAGNVLTEQLSRNCTVC